VATIFIDDKQYQVKDGEDLLQEILGLGFDLPYFCWHPALGSVGACRQCAIKQFRDEKDTRGRLVMACMTPATDGARISIDDPEAKQFRAAVAEWLMVNHPQDCPVCDEGGECHLQDMTVMNGHTYRRYDGKKRTFRNQYLGPFVNHEMNRCIQCYRCVRYYREYAGGRDFDVFGSRNQAYYGRATDGVLENEFSGNLIEICPTGVFTDKTFKQHFTRKWDLTTAPSICVHCGLGCNTIPGERYGTLRRIRNRYNGQVNGYFLCDRGRFGYEFVNSDQRIRQPQMRADRTVGLSPTDRETALQRAKEFVPGKVIGIGSPRASLEANFALRAFVGEENFYNGISERESRLVMRMVDILRNGPARSPSLRECAKADAVLVLGEDVTNTAPMLALALRQSVRCEPVETAKKLKIPEWDDKAVREATQQQKGPLFIATPNATRLDDVATQTYRAAPDDIARLGFAVARALNPNAPDVPNLSDETRALVATIAEKLKNAKRPLVVAGPSCGSEQIIQAAANIAWALCASDHAAELSFAMPEVNSLGLALIGGESLDAAMRAAQDGNVDTIIVLENDLYRRADATAVDDLLARAKRVIVIDYLANATSAKAALVLPAATFAEADGTFVNNEGRAQRFFQVFVPGDAVQESWRWVRDLMIGAGRVEATAWQNLDDMTAALASAVPILKTVPDIAPPAGFRIAGQKIARESHRYSGRTAMRANISVHEPRPPDDPDSALTFTMEGYDDGNSPPALIPRFWSPGWNSIQSLNRFQEEIGGPLRGGDPGRRLIEPVQARQPNYFRDIPPAFQPRTSEWLVVPLYHIFGSEELSVHAPGIAQLSPQPYVALNPQDAAKLNVGDGAALELAIADVAQRLPAKIIPVLPVGVVGLPVGLPGMPYAALPAFGKLAKTE
jgi:NADH-quinone oxidoreductase subunit G